MADSPKTKRGLNTLTIALATSNSPKEKAPKLLKSLGVIYIPAISWKTFSRIYHLVFEKSFLLNKLKLFFRTKVELYSLYFTEFVTLGRLNWLMTPDFIRKYEIYKILIQTTIGNCKSKKDIQDILEDKFINDYRGDKLYEGLLKNNEKTISRDIKDIQAFFNIDVQHIKKSGYYLTSDSTLLDEHRTIFDKMELFLMSHKEQEWSPFITTEISSLNINIDIIALVKAIEDNKYINLTYKGWYDDDDYNEIKSATVQPLHIKECQRAWYLLVHNKDIGVKVLCLDRRVSDLKITNKEVVDPYVFSEESYFNDAFGILKTDMPAERIVLKVANHHFKYLVSKPLHHTQKIISSPLKKDTTDLDYTDEAIFGEIELFLEPNYEFLIELFKYHFWVKVTEPKWLAKKIAEQHKYILEHYYPEF